MGSFIFGCAICLALLGFVIALLLQLETKENIGIGILLIIGTCLILKIFAWSMGKYDECKSLFWESKEYSLQDNDKMEAKIEKIREKLGC